MSITLPGGVVSFTIALGILIGQAPSAVAWWDVPGFYEHQWMAERSVELAACFTYRDRPSLGYIPSEYYAIPDAAGDWGKYIPYPYRGYPSGYDNVDNAIANAWSNVLVPRCCEFGAALIVLFYDKANVMGR
jgi:hypothetical protein